MTYKLKTLISGTICSNNGRTLQSKERGKGGVNESEGYVTGQ